MGDGADWTAPIRVLDSNVLEGLARALRLLSDEAVGFTFQALWIRDEPETRARVPLREVVVDVLNNRVRNKHVSIVGKSAG
jgi:hypothetical protein